MKKLISFRTYDRSFFLLLALALSLALILSAFQWHGRSLEKAMVLTSLRDLDQAEIEIIHIKYPKPQTEVLQSRRALGPIEITAAPEPDPVGLEPEINLYPLPLVPIEVDTATDVFVPLGEHYPIFPGGDEALLIYLSRHTRYTPQARDQGVQGMVYVQFVVQADGSIAHVRVVRGLGFGLDEEAIRTVRSMPRWQPGYQGGKPVDVAYTLPIRFTLK
jgi:TonB family protein